MTHTEEYKALRDELRLQDKPVTSPIADQIKHETPLPLAERRALDDDLAAPKGV